MNFAFLIVENAFLWYNIWRRIRCPDVCEVNILRVSYKKLWVMLAEREMSKAELRKLAGIAPATFTKLGRNQEVALSVLLRIAEVMDCDAGDIMSFVKENDQNSNTNS